MPSEPGSEEQTSSSKMQKALNGEYPFTIFSVIRRANLLVKQHFGSLFQGCVVLFIALILLGVMLVVGFDITNPENITPGQQTLFEVIGVLIISPLQAGLYMMALNAARGNKITTFDIFAYVPLVLVIASTQLMISICTQLGLALLIVPGVYIWTATIFSLTLVADKRLGPLQAISLSVRMVNTYLTSMLAIAGIVFLLFGTALLTFGVTLIWVMPLYFCIIGVLYNDLFSEDTIIKSESDNDESRFDA